jgi:hypothetical protein
MRRMALIGLAVMMAFVLATSALHAQQAAQQQQEQQQQGTQQGQFVCPWATAGQAGGPGPHHGRMRGGRHMMGPRCMMRSNNMPANCPRLTGADTTTPPVTKQ